MFSPLEREDVERIIDIELREILSRVEALGYRMTVSQAARELIVQQGYDRQFGARPLKRALQTLVEDVVAQQIVAGAIAPGDAFTIDAAEGSTVLVKNAE